MFVEKSISAAGIENVQFVYGHWTKNEVFCWGFLW